MPSSANDNPKKSKKKGRTAHEGKKGQGKGVPRPEEQREASPKIQPSPELQEALEETGGSDGEQGTPKTERRGGGGDREATEPNDRQVPGRAARGTYDDSGLPTMPDYGLYGGPMGLDREARTGKAKDRKAPGKSSPNPAPGRSEPPKEPDDRRGEGKRSDKA